MANGLVQPRFGFFDSSFTFLVVACAGAGRGGHKECRACKNNHHICGFDFCEQALSSQRLPTPFAASGGVPSVDKTPRQEVPFNPFLLPRGLAPFGLQPRYGFVAEGAIQQTL